MQKAHRVIVAIGSNCHRHANMQKAMLLIGLKLQGAVFTQAIDTAPIGMQSATFLNAMAAAYTPLGIDETIMLLKDIETECGNTTKLRNEGKIIADLDLLLYDDEHLHKADWERPYIKQLLKELENKKHQQTSTLEL